MSDRLKAALEMLSRAQGFIDDEIADRDAPELRAAEEAVRAACEAVREAMQL